MKIGEHLRKLRKERKLTLKELAKKVDLSYSYLSQIETGERGISVDIIRKISNALAVDYNELMRMAGFLDDENNFPDPFERIDKTKKWVIKFEVPQMESIIDKNHDTVTTRVIPMEEALSRFLEIENLFTMEYPLYFQGKKLSSHQRNQLLQIAKIIFTPSEDKED